MEYQVRFEEAGKFAGARVVLYAVVEAESLALAVAYKQLVAKLQRSPELLGFKAASVWSELGGVVIL